MYISEEEAKGRLEGSGNILNRLSIVNRYNGGNKPGPNLSFIDKVLIGSLAHVEKGKDVAKAFDVTPQQVSNIKNGNTSPKVTEKIDKTLGKVQNKALDIVMSSLGLIDEGKLSDQKPRDLISIARDAATVYEKVSPKVDQSTNVGIQVVLHGVEQRKESDYEVVEINNQS